MHRAQYEGILSYCKGASRHGKRNCNKFHISGAEVLIFQITAQSNVAFNVCLQTLFQELDSVKVGYVTVGRQRDRIEGKSVEIKFLVKCVKREVFNYLEDNILIAEARCMLDRGLFQRPWAFFSIGLFPFLLWQVRM